MLLAEKDREYLKQLRRNREEERDLMKNVEGWKVGTLYGEPVYKNQTGEETLFRPVINEYYVHAPASDLRKRAEFRLWC